jgi:hypothetical protein
MALKLPLFAAGALWILGCVAPPSQATRATDAARELNLASRFGRMDIALGNTAPGARESFLERRVQWGKEVRIVDVELAGMSMKDELNAVIQVDVAWVRADDDTLRATRIAQTWRDDGGWHLMREQRMAGDLGLFGERVTMTPVEQRDVQFPSKTIGE